VRSLSAAPPTPSLEAALTSLALAGLVFYPRILPEHLQRALVAETLQHARSPNLTQLDKLYDLPREGLWGAWAAGKGDEVVPRLVEAREEGATAAAGSFSVSALGVDAAKSPRAALGGDEAAHEPVTVRELLPKLRWANVGWFYNVRRSLSSALGTSVRPTS